MKRPLSRFLACFSHHVGFLGSGQASASSSSRGGFFSFREDEGVVSLSLLLCTLFFLLGKGVRQGTILEDEVFQVFT